MLSYFHHMTYGKPKTRMKSAPNFFAKVIQLNHNFSLIDYYALLFAKGDATVGRPIGLFVIWSGDFASSSLLLIQFLQVNIYGFLS